MNLFRSFLVLALAGTALAACGGLREDLGLGRSPPDEFAVIDRPPLAMPPDFGLRPPAPGAPRPQEIDPSIHASEALFGSGTGDASAAASSNAPSALEQTLLQQTGADKALPDIRVVINNESYESVDADPHLMDRLLWWKNDTKPGAVVDAEAEMKRIKDARDKGEPLNQSPTPIIEREKSGWLGL